jgi:hypothetical protein
MTTREETAKATATATAKAIATATAKANAGVLRFAQNDTGFLGLKRRTMATASGVEAVLNAIKYCTQCSVT